MAQLDSSIFFQQKTPDINGAIDQGLNSGMKMREMLDARNKQQQIQQIKKASGGKMSDMINNLNAAGFTDEALDYTAKDNANQKFAHDKQINQLDMAARLLGSTKDQSSWDAALSEAPKYGIDISNVPKVFDPKYRQQALDQSVSYLDKLKNDREQYLLSLEERKVRAAERNADTKAGAVEGFKATDRDYAKDYNDWTGSGKSSLEKNLALLEEAKGQLQNDHSLTGPIRGLAPDMVRNLTNEKAIQVRDKVRQAAQGALKATLGAQFTEKEGERIMNQAYNEKLSPEANIEKINTAIQELARNKAVADAKAEYFQKRGTLKGFNYQDVRPQASSPSNYHQMSDEELTAEYNRKIKGQQNANAR